MRNRFFLLFGLSLFAVFGSQRAIIGGSSLAGSGPLAVVILSFVAGQGWEIGEKVCLLVVRLWICSMENTNITRSDDYL